MEETTMSPAVSDTVTCGCERDVFERVWRRVMPEGTGDISVEMTPVSAEEPRMQTVWQQELSPMPEREPMCTLSIQDGVDTLCLGSGAAVYAPLLQEMVDGEMEDWRLYQTMARRAAGNASKVLGTLAAEERKHMRKLSAAYFIITGERCQPRGQGGSRPVPDVMNGLREQFIQEQRGAAAYQGAAAESSDPCLRQLFRELAQEEGMHARTVRSLLEQMG